MLTLEHKRRNEKIMKAIEVYTIKHTATKEAARAALVKSGICHEDGSLCPEYGGVKPC